DHYAIIPTVDQVGKASSLSPIAAKVYELILRRFLAIFCPDAEFLKVALVVKRMDESFFANFKVMTEEGYQKVFSDKFFKKQSGGKGADASEGDGAGEGSQEDAEGEGGTAKDDGKQEDIVCDENFINYLSSLKKHAIIEGDGFTIKEGETSPPKRYNSGSMILAMENAGQFIEDEELRAQIKTSGIGTSATRAEILKKLVSIEYLALNKKTQIYTPTRLGESIFYVVRFSMPEMLMPDMTASWEKGLSQVAEGTLTADAYMTTLGDFVRRRIDGVKQRDERAQIRHALNATAQYYKNTSSGGGKKGGYKKKTSSGGGKRGGNKTGNSGTKQSEGIIDY
ncbi:MAG: type IA DNA topoisomerase, partial [Lachnospiraceae bacterium]|nr:type IA DNA topoisomerase [Lachnospiraceae bacterium]